MKQTLKDRNGKKFEIGDICKYHKVKSGNENQLYVVIEKEGILGLHRQGFWEEHCVGCWDFTTLEEESLKHTENMWETNGKNYDYKDEEEYLDLYCIEIIGSVKKDKDKFELDPRYYKK